MRGVMSLGNRGRKSLADEWLTEDSLLKLEGLARDKITDKDIALNYIGVAERTFTEWKAKYPAIVTALKKGRAPIAEKVETSLYDLCEVQEYIDTIIEEFYDSSNKLVSRHIRKTKRQVPPNPTAIIFALKNLKPGKWREKQQIALNADNNGMLADLIDGLKQKETETSDKE